MDKVEKAVKLHQTGYNCAQAVVCAFSEEVGVEEQILFRVAEGFGSGMGGGQYVCGALSGAVMVGSLKNCSGIPGDRKSLENTLAVSRRITQAFHARNGSTLCKHLKGAETGRELRSCDECVADAVKLVKKIVFPS